MKRCVFGIRPIELSEATASGKQVPTVWLPSMATLAAVLPEDIRALLRLIRQAKPKTMTELAALLGRQVPNLSRTLRMMEVYGLVALTRNARQTRPTALDNEFQVVLN